MTTSSTGKKKSAWWALGFILLCAGSAQAAATRYGPKLIHSFTGDAVEGGTPATAPTEGIDGNYYGATLHGGASGNGTLYRMTPDGQLTTLHSLSNSDGLGVYGALVRDAAGNLYGTASYAGPSGQGTIFRLTEEGQFSVVHAFSATNGAGQNADGAGPGSLSLGPDGGLYGITGGGGPGGNGVLFKLATDGSYSVVYAFGTDAVTADIHPYSRPLIAPDGTIYGTSHSGGTYSFGAIYKLSPDGTLSLIYSFQPSEMGYPPSGDIVLGNDGKTLYGLINPAPQPSLLYKLTATGEYTVLHTAAPWWGYGNADGEVYTSLMQGPDGTLYVTAYGGGPFYNDDFDTGGGGTVFEVTPSGKFAVLDFFGANPVTDGLNPVSVQMSSDGTLWGATASGGLWNATSWTYGGLIYTLPLPPPARWGTVAPVITASFKPAVIHPSVDRKSVLIWRSKPGQTCYIQSFKSVTEEIPPYGSMVFTPFLTGYPQSLDYQISCTYNGVASTIVATLKIAAQ